MTPAEHYAEAESWATVAENQMKVIKGQLENPLITAADFQAIIPTIQMTLQMAQIHATLATAHQ